MPPVSRLAVSLLLLLLPALAQAQLNDTGQTACTDSAGLAIACAAPGGHPGQDGRFGRDAQAGAAAFSLASANGCVQDGVTGLTWAGETLAPAPWADFNGMAYDRCGIDSGWRLPTRRELLSTVHHGQSHPASTLPNTQSAPHWSSDVQGGNAWAVDFTDGDTKTLPQTESHPARLVARPANQPPTITLGANIVVPQGDKPGLRTYPAWATGISPGPAREAGQHLTATVELLPLQPGDPKALEFDTPPAIDPATGNLTFTIQHRIDLGVDEYHDNWVSSAGLARLRVTLQDDGGTAHGGQDTASADFTIFLVPAPLALDINIKHPWKPACIPFTTAAMDVDTDWDVGGAVWTDGMQWPYPTYEIINHPTRGFLTDYVSRRTPDGDEVIRFASARGSFDYVLPKTGYVKAGTQAAAQVVPSPASASATASSFPNDGTFMWPRPPHLGGERATSEHYGFNYTMTHCYVPFSSTRSGSDSFTYQVTDPDGNKSGIVSVSIEIFED